MMRVFVCDDHGIVREGTKSVLGQIPSVEVVGEASSAEEMVGRLAETPFDLAVIDITLGDMDGISLAQRIKAVRPQARVVALTYHREPSTIQAFLATGAEGYLLKDDPPEKFREAIEQVLTGHRALSAEVSHVLVSSWQDRGPRAGVSLTDKEKEVLRLLFRGRINKEIAADLGVSVKTIEKSRASLMRKSGARTAVELTTWALRSGWVDDQES